VVQLGGHNHVAGLQCRQERGALGPFGQVGGAADAAFHEDVADLQALHHGVPADLTALQVEAFALVGLPLGGNPGVAVDIHARPLVTLSQRAMGRG
jgi:hypothetical protein